MNELVSIIMPSYNTASYIGDSIQSVLNQTYPCWELIIVDDCSTDHSVEVIQSFADSRIILIQNEQNSGAAVSRNKALREARGKWIAFLDSDDLWAPEKLEKQIWFMVEHDYHFSYTSYYEIDAVGNRNGVTVSGPNKITHSGFMNYCWPGCLTVVYDADEIGLIQIPEISKNNDYAMWLRVSKKANCYLLNESLAMYRRGRTGSVSTETIMTMIGWHYKLFRIAEQQNVLSAAINTVRNLLFGTIKKALFVKR